MKKKKAAHECGLFVWWPAVADSHAWTGKTFGQTTLFGKDAIVRLELLHKQDLVDPFFLGQVNARQPSNDEDHSQSRDHARDSGRGQDLNIIHDKNSSKWTCYWKAPFR